MRGMCVLSEKMTEKVYDGVCRHKNPDANSRIGFFVRLL